jgi:hypothetical protein
MTEEEYKRLISEDDVLDHTTLNVTLKEVASRKKMELAREIERILKNNKIEEPEGQEKSYSIHYYKIDLSSEHIDQIIDILFELEENYLGTDGAMTPTASFYGALADKWDKLP